jgi:16S rRNA processing protein RimM
MKMLRLQDLAYIGVVKKTHGFKGQLKISINTPEAEELDTEQIFILIDEKPVPFFVEDISGTTAVWIVKLEDCNSEQEALEYFNCKVYVLKSLLPDNLIDTKAIPLIGYQVIDNELGTLGLVTDYIERPAQDLIVMNWQDEEHYIPVDKSIIQIIKHNKKEILVILPEGLLNLNG